jgi:cystathionine gamma-lyase
MHFRTRAIHVGQEDDPTTGAVVPPIYLASTFTQPGPGEWGAFDYSRSGNPTRKAFETTMASLENGVGALAYATGMAATTGVMMLLRPGDHIVAGSDLYGGSYRLFHKIAGPLGITCTLVPTNDLARVAAAFRPETKLLWLESPGNPLLSITDLEACCAIAQQRGVLSAVDSTFATPVLTRPLDLGADIVMHSATKYIGGHSDLVGGVLVAKSEEVLKRLYMIQNATGSCLGPLECFLCSRGLKTLDLRVREQCRSTQRIAEWLNGDSRVSRVLYPGLPGHPGHEIAQKQMGGLFGAMLTLEVHGGFEAAKRMVASTELFRLAVSLGAVESLIEQPASMSHAAYDRHDRLAHGITDGLVRLSIGLEHLDDLQADLDQALAAAAKA